MNVYDYFLSKKGFQRFFEECFNKYKSYGKVTGVVSLEAISAEEADTFTIFFGKIYEEGMTARIKVKEFLKAISNTKLEEFDFLTYFKIVHKDFNGLSRSEERLKKKVEYQEYLLSLPVGLKLKEIITRSSKNFNTILYSRYNKNHEELTKELVNINILLENIPQKATLLSVYAVLTGNSHYLDFDKPTLFYQILSIYLGKSYENTISCKKNLLNSINVYMDRVSNYVVTYNLKINMMFDEFYKTYGPLSLNLDNISSLKSIGGVNNQIYIFENPSVLNYLKSNDVKASIIICNGMPNLAMYSILDRINPGCEIYYHGDYDPEGLLIADKLKKYSSHLILWGYDRDFYLESKPNKRISDGSIHKLNLVTSLELQEVKECLLEYRQSGYEENILDKIKLFIEKRIGEFK